MYSAGTAFLTVVPSFHGIEGAFRRELDQIGRQIDHSIANAIPNGVREGLNRSDRDVDRAGRRAGDRYAGAFAENMERRLAKAANAFQDVKITADSSDLDRELAEVRKDLLELRDAHVNLDVDAEFAMLEMQRISDKLRELQGRDATIDVHFNVAAALVELDALQESARQSGRRSGDEFSDHFTREVRRRVATARGIFATINVDVNSTEVEQDIAAIDTVLGQIGDATIDVNFNQVEVLRDIELVEAKLRELAHSDPSVRIRTNALAVLAEVDAITHVFRGQQEELDRAHAAAAAEDEKRTRDRMQLLDDAHAEDEKRTRDQMRLLNDAHAEDERRIRDQMRLLNDAHNENERRDRDLIRMHREAADENERFDRDRQRRQGGVFGDQQRRRLIASRDALPDIEPHLQTRAVQGEMARLRTELETLANVTIDVDMPMAQVLAEAAKIEAALRVIEENEIDVTIRANARAALAELRAMITAADAAGNQAGDEFGGSFIRSIRDRVRAARATITDLPIGVNTTQAQIDLDQLSVRMKLLGDVRIGVDMDLADFLAETRIIDAELAALDVDGVDIQVRLEARAARLELAAVHEQVNRLDGDDVNIHVDTNALQRLGLEAGTSLNRLGALIAVGAALGTSLVPAAAAAAASISAIATAASVAALGVGVFALGIFGVLKGVQALSAYQRDTTKSAQSLSGAENRVEGALDGVRGAAAGVQSAQRNLARAEKDAAETTKDLTKAREAARQSLEDMAFQLRSNTLEQRQARLDEEAAKKDLDKLLANPRATEAEREQAKITFEQKMLQIEELNARQQRLVVDEAEARKKGIEGSDQVQAAQTRIVDAVERVRDAQDAVASSQRSLVAANRSLQQAYEKTGTAGGSAMQELERAMNALSPAGRRFALFIFGLKDEFRDLQHAAEEGLLPGLQQGITNLLPYLKPLKTLIGDVAKVLGDGFVAATEALKDPTWRKFFGYLADVAVPTLKGMMEFFGNVAEGFAGILLGLSGFNGPIGQGMLKWSEDFAKWGTTLDSNAGWQKFIQYVKDSWPEVRDFFHGLWEFTKKFVAAAAPVGEWVVGAFATLFEWMNKLDTETWSVIIAGIAGIAAALLIMSGIITVVGFLAESVIGAIVVGIILWASEMALLLKYFTPLRVVAEAVFNAIGVAWSWLWENLLKPGFEGLKFVVGLVGDLFMWLWDHVLSHLFAAWKIGFEVLWTVFQVFWGLIQIGVKAFGLLWSAIYPKYFEPLVNLLRPFFKWLGEIWESTILPNLKKGFKALGDLWDGFVGLLKIPVRFVIETLLNDGLLAGYNKVAKFFKIKPDDVKIDLPKGFAHGGAVYGPGTTTSDSIPARLSKGEHVWTAQEVAAAGGHGMVYTMRQMVLDGIIPGFASGGAVGDDEGWFSKLKKKASDVYNTVKDFVSDPAGALKNLFKKLLDLVPNHDAPVTQVVLGMPGRILDMAVDQVKGLFGGGGSGGPGGAGPGFLPWPGSPGAQRGDTGVWHNIVDLVNASGIPHTFGNSYRAGDPLWHGSGRAVDYMGFNQDALAQFFINRLPNVLELIHTTDSGGYYVTRGKRYADFAVQGPLHRNHLHIAMDQGGWLPTGMSSIVNNTGQPEPVLTGQQWRDINVMARHGGAGGPTYNFEFRDTTLDPGKLRALQDREDARTRQGRAR